MVEQTDIFNALKKIGIARDDIGGLQITDFGQVQFTIEVDPDRGAELEDLRQQAEKAIAALDGVTRAMAILTAQKKAPMLNAAQNKSSDPHGMNKNPRLDDLPIKHIIAVASGKGGVGKSTVAVNIARAFAAKGQRVGLLDADIYGPSVPMMMGIEATKPKTENGQLVPLEKDGLKIMSIGFVTEGEQALIWRGPMIQTALYQMLRDVAWGTHEDPLDILVIDMPPGTGDAQLTLAQKVPVDGAIIVSTPQDIALIDARKAVQMFRKTGVPVLGVIENMSTHICSNCGAEEHIFGHGGAQAEAAALDIPFLGNIPLDINIRLKSDAGETVKVDAFQEIISKLNIGKK